MVPNLITALNGPINEIEQRMLDSLPAIERWFRLEWMEHTPTFYTAVDLRNAGFKLAPVATRLFPGGFNHLTTAMMPLAVQAAMAAIEKICPEAKNLLMIPEPRAAEPDYLANLDSLANIFHMAGLNVRMGTLDPAITQPTPVTLANGGSLTLEPLQRNRGRLGLKNFDPCTILLNAEIPGGVPRVIEHLHEQYLLPPLHAGASARHKARHFQAYEEVAKKFAKLLGLDPWLINPISAGCQTAALSDRQTIDALSTQADAVLTKLRRKYKEYGIAERPFLMLKADLGGRGFGPIALRDARELAEFVRPADLAKGGDAKVVDFLFQEGVPSTERMQGAVAEPVVYMIDRYVVGGFYRVHPEQGIDADLSAPGAQIVPLEFAESSHLPRPGAKPGASAPNRFYMYGVVARLAMVAASYELEATDPDAEHYS